MCGGVVSVVEIVLCVRVCTLPHHTQKVARLNLLTTRRVLKLVLRVYRLVSSHTQGGTPAPPDHTKCTGVCATCVPLSVVSHKRWHAYPSWSSELMEFALRVHHTASSHTKNARQSPPASAHAHTGAPTRVSAVYTLPQVWHREIRWSQEAHTRPKNDALSRALPGMSTVSSLRTARGRRG